jgi:hypothetical protein
MLAISAGALVHPSADPDEFLYLPPAIVEMGWRKSCA